MGSANVDDAMSAVDTSVKTDRFSVTNRFRSYREEDFKLRAKVKG